MPRTITFLICSVGLLAAIGYFDLRDDAKSLLRQVIPEAKRTAVELLEVLKEEIPEPQTGEITQFPHVATTDTVHRKSSSTDASSQSQDGTNTTMLFRNGRPLPLHPAK